MKLEFAPVQVMWFNHSIGEKWTVSSLTSSLGWFNAVFTARVDCIFTHNVVDLTTTVSGLFLTDSIIGSYVNQSLFDRIQSSECTSVFQFLSLLFFH